MHNPDLLFFITNTFPSSTGTHLDGAAEITYEHPIKAINKTILLNLFDFIFLL